MIMPILIDFFNNSFFRHLLMNSNFLINKCIFLYKIELNNGNLFFSFKFNLSLKLELKIDYQITLFIKNSIVF